MSTHAALTLVNLNMLFLRYGEEIERELHVPLGPLYLTRALEDAGVAVDFRDYQRVPSDDPFDLYVFLNFLEDAAPVVGLSCMANLLPFTLLAAKAVKERWPEKKVVLGGVGAKAVEEKVLTRFPWVDVVSRGEAELSGPLLVKTLAAGGDLAGVPGVSYRGADGRVIHNPRAPRVADLDRIPFPAWDRIDLGQYAGYGMMTSRGCPYPCTFCSVAPVWDYESYNRSAANIVAEMKELHERAGVGLFLFQDEFFVSGKKQVMAFCEELARVGLKVKWKAFGRVNLCDVEMMRAMAASGCVELRFGIESGSDAVLKRVKKGFTAAETLEVVPQAIELFPRVDAFYVWGFPFETMDDFRQSLFQMVALRMMGARILPSLLSLLPQTPVYRECVEEEGRALEFCPHLFPEFVFTGHEVMGGGEVSWPARYAPYFDFITAHADIFAGFFHVDLENNVLPKLELMRQFGFYPTPKGKEKEAGAASLEDGESCGAHSPRYAPQDLATRAGE